MTYKVQTNAKKTSKAKTSILLLHKYMLPPCWIDPDNPNSTESLINTDIFDIFDQSDIFDILVTVKVFLILNIFMC